MAEKDNRDIKFKVFYWKKRKRKSGRHVHVVMERGEVPPTDQTSIPMREGRRSTLGRILNSIDYPTCTKVLVSYKDVLNQYFKMAIYREI